MSNARKTEISLQLFRTIQFLKEVDAALGGSVPQQQAPQSVANSNPMQPLPGQGQQQIVGSSSGEPMSSTGEPLSIDTMINKMNVIRGGRSFSEPEVYGQLTTLYKNLSDQDKTTIDRVLTDIGKIIIDQPAAQPVAGQMQGTTPAQPPPGGAGRAPAQQAGGAQGAPMAAPGGQGGAAPGMA